MKLAIDPPDYFAINPAIYFYHRGQNEEWAALNPKLNCINGAGKVTLVFMRVLNQMS